MGEGGRLVGAWPEEVDPTVEPGKELAWASDRNDLGRQPGVALVVGDLNSGEGCPTLGKLEELPRLVLEVGPSPKGAGARW